MTEITRILYAKVQERSQKNILRLHNQTFLHAIACLEVIGKPIKLTERKFYGRYLHSLITHAPLQHRIICSRSTNTEQQERHFNTFSSVSLSTSSRRPGEIITPGMIRMQAEMKEGENNRRNALQEQESRLGKLSRCLPKADNSVIPHGIILKYTSAYQAHLERISDFLLCGEGVWWRHIVSGVEFFDVSVPSEAQRGATTLPPLHHFRSYSLKSESEYLQNSWRKCLQSVDTLKIPHQAIRVFDGQGELDHIIYTDFLQDDDDDDVDDDGEGESQNSNPDNDIMIDSNDHLERDCRLLASDGKVGIDCNYSDDDDEEEEENIVAVLQVGECLLEQNETAEGIAEQEKQEAEIIPTHLESSVESHGTSHCINQQNSSMSKSPLSSVLATNVAKILGETADVKKLDHHRTQLRKNPTSKSVQQDYQTQLAYIQTQVLAKHSQLASSFKEWEALFTSNNNGLEPTLDEIEKDEKGCNLYKALRLCRQLLKHWNITVHL